MVGGEGRENGPLGLRIRCGAPPRRLSPLRPPSRDVRVVQRLAQANRAPDFSDMLRRRTWS